MVFAKRILLLKNCGTFSEIAEGFAISLYLGTNQDAFFQGASTVQADNGIPTIPTRPFCAFPNQKAAL